MPITDTLTATWLKERFLFGIDLTDDSGTAYPDSMFTHCLESATAVLEAELDIVLTDLITYTERRDALDSDALCYFLQSVDHRPLREIVTLNCRFGGFEALEIPKTWAHISSPMAGQIQVIPSPDAITGIAAMGVPYIGNINLLRGYTPLWWEITYKAGYDGTTYPSPKDILECIGLMAAMLPLDTAGDLLLGAGIASQSVSLDGLSTSTGTTSSATNAGYGARVIQYGKRLDRTLKNIRRKYRAPNVMVI